MRSIVRRRFGFATLVVTVALGIWFAQSPVSQAELSATSPILTDRHGARLNVRTVENGTWRVQADLDNIDPAFVDALIEIEDRRYYSHAGVDGAAILRALRTWQKSGVASSGASTLTMQLVRQYKPRPRTLRSKVIESFEALRFELHFSKRELLEQYLTRVSYGGNIEGIDAASQIYFGKSPRYLSTDEIGLLIALPQAPEARRPDRNAQAAKVGRERILKRLLAADFITPREFSNANTAPVPLEKSRQPEQAWLTAQKLASSGELTKSWLDPRLQRRLQNQLSLAVDRLPHAVNASAILVHAPTREVRAHAAIGRRDHDGGWLDMTAAIRSPGSTLKPFVYGLGMDDGLIGTQTRLRDAPSRFGSYRPENFDRRYYGDVTMAQALQHSLNIPAVGVLDHVGGRRLDSALRAAGASPSQSGPNDDGHEARLSLALGGTGLRATDLAMLYTTIANDGIAAPLKWTQTDTPADHGFELLQADTARSLRRVMSAAPRPAGVMPAHLSKHAPDVAYKTGTSYGFRDSWAAGISGDYVIVVWMGRPDGGPRPGVTGREAAAPLLFQVADSLARDDRAPALHRSQKTAERLKAPEEIAPVILFPMNDTEITMNTFGEASEGIDLLVQAEGRDVRLYVDAEPITKGRNGYRYKPTSPGFYDLTVIDEVGRKSKGRFRVVSLQDTRHPGL
jgi:penicillin-binding protein 1C